MEGHLDVSFNLYNMPGICCSAVGCSKRKQNRNNIRSDSDGSEDEESCIKRQHSRTFHR